MAIIPITTSELAIITPLPPTPPASRPRTLRIQIPPISLAESLSPTDSKSSSPAESQPSSGLVQPPSTPTMAAYAPPFVSQNPQHPLPAWARNFPEPSSPIDIEKALNSEPPRWTFQVSLKASLKREAIAEQEGRPHFPTQAQVQADMAIAKVWLRDLAKRMDAKDAKRKRMNVDNLDGQRT